MQKVTIYVYTTINTCHISAGSSNRYTILNGFITLHKRSPMKYDKNVRAVPSLKLWENNDYNHYPPGIAHIEDQGVSILKWS